MRYLVAAVWIAVSLLACGDSDSVVGDNNGDQRTEEDDRAQLAEMRREIDALVGDAAGRVHCGLSLRGRGLQALRRALGVCNLLRLVNRFDGTSRAADSVITSLKPR